jgi:DNA-binding beta-propeller fold protein YncE
MVFVSDQTKSRLAIIDTSTNKIKTWVALPSPGYASTPTLDGRCLLVALKTANKLAVLDLERQQVVRTIDVPAGPQEIVMRPDGRRGRRSKWRFGVLRENGQHPNRPC